MNQSDLEAAFMEAFESYGDALFRFCMVKVSNAPLAEDFTQEVFMRYWQALRSGQQMTNTRAYLYTIANNMAKDWYKRKKADSLEQKMESGFEPRAHDLSSENAAAYEEVLSAIEDMEEKDREVLLLRHVEGFEPRDIAEMLGESANVVSVRLNRAMKRLQERLHV